MDINLLIVAVYSYLLGSIPFGLILTKVFLKKDIRKVGSGNIGTTNVLRTGKKSLVIATLTFDLLKGYISVYFTLLYFAIDISDVEKPPVAKVVIACAIASKKFIPKKYSRKAQIKVRKKYIIPMILAICPALGNTFSDESEDSVWNNCIPPTFKIGKKAIAITTIPIPPSHCNSERHIKIPWDNESRFDNTVDPVVVIPDIDSKNASVKDNFKSENIKGKEPKNEIKIQLKVVNKKACFIEIVKFSDLFANNKIIPKNKQINDENVKACHWLSL